ncbi:hypothetical protein [Qipengyuania nanhaisediminis]|uniref:hypothetical protein n=1 Tax=Qipengyuania nanhaisediminis TaxID=604088 RepID=UPI0038B41600
MTRTLARLFSHVIGLVALAWSGAALADVQIHFHSFNGSVFGGRYPHTFIVLDGTIEATGEPVNENYGFTARSVTAAATRDWAAHRVESEPERYIRSTNRHFTLSLTDEQYYAIIREVRAWALEPGKRYSLDQRNCIHFVGRMAQILGLRVDYPQDMLRRPKKWLNHVTALNPQLRAPIID